MDNISEFALFRAIVQSGGISAGAFALHSSPPVVSRRLAALERRLGVRLAQRSSRRFKLTDEGLLLYERCCSILAQIRAAEAEVASRGGAARGLLRIGAPADFGRHHIAPLLADFTSRHSGLYTQLLPSDAGLEVGVDPCDVILRFGLPNDLGVIARKLVSTASVLCAAPAYLAKHGAPMQPAELGDHNCLRLQGRHRLNDVWHFDNEGTRQDVRVDGTLSSTSGEVLLQWALAGEGISQEAYWDVAEHIANGRLVRVLPEYTCPALDLYAIYASGSPIPPRIRLFVDYIDHVLRARMPRAA